jgi:hypothetical protein
MVSPNVEKAMRAMATDPTLGKNLKNSLSAIENKAGVHLSVAEKSEFLTTIAKNIKDSKRAAIVDWSSTR